MSMKSSKKLIGKAADWLIRIIHYISKIHMQDLLVLIRHLIFD